MDFAGPLIQSVLYKYSCYCGTVDAGSGYGRVWPDRLMTTHNVLSFLESNRIKGHIDGGLGVRVDLGRTRWSNAKIDQKVTNEDNFFGCEHGTKVLCLSAGQGDGALHL